MTCGITPIDNAFELIGLHQSSALMRYIFIETLAGKVIFVSGFLFSMSRSLKNANFSSVIFFCSIFFSFLFLLIMPRTPLRLPLSGMEGGGYVQIRTDDILRKAGIDQLLASPVVVFLAEGMSAFTNGMISVVDRARGHNASFLKEPFSTSKFWLLTRDRLMAGLNDQLLKEKLVNFYQDHYFQALRTLNEKDPLVGQSLWPGSEEILPLYTSQAASDWRVLEDAIYTFINKDELFERVSRDYYDGSSLKDAAVRALIEADAAHASWAYTAMSFSGQKETAQARSMTLNVRAGAMVDQMSRVWLSVFPVLYGACLWSVWAAFPFFLVFVFFSSDISLLWVFLKYLFVLKLIPLFWAIIDRVSSLVFDVNNILYGGKVFLWDMPLVGVVGLLAMAVLLLPLMMFKRKGAV